MKSRCNEDEEGTCKLEEEVGICICMAFWEEEVETCKREEVVEEICKLVGVETCTKGLIATAIDAQKIVKIDIYILERSSSAHYRFTISMTIEFPCVKAEASGCGGFGSYL